MGYYGGDAPKSILDDVYSLLLDANGKRGEMDVGVRWGVGTNAYYELLKCAPTSVTPLTNDGVTALFGLPIQIDSSLPDTTIEFRNIQGKVVGRIENISAPPAPERCAACGDKLPEGALYCITCSRPVAATGPTRRL